MMTQSPKYGLGYNRYLLALWNQGNWPTQYLAEQLTQTNGMVHEANYTTSIQTVFHRTKRDSLRQDRYFAKIHNAYLRYVNSVKAPPDLEKLQQTEPNIISSHAQNGIT
jgi:hypothetical protein